MALAKPPKDYYSLAEIAEEWGWPLSEIFDYGKQGKLEICIWFKCTEATLCEIDYEKERLEYGSFNLKEIKCVILDGAYPLLPSQLDEVEGLDADIDIFFQDIKLLKLQPFMASFEPIPSGNVKYGYDFGTRYSDPWMVITHEEKIRFEQASMTNGTTIEIPGAGIGNKERGTWLKIIYLLAVKVAEKNKAAFLSKGTLNAIAFEKLMKTIARELEMVSSLDAADQPEQIKNITYGMYDSTLSKIFNEGEKIVSGYFE